MTDNRRRFPRIPFDSPAELEVRLQATQPGAASRRVRLAVTIETLSPEGVGVIMTPVHSFVPSKGTLVTTCLKVKDHGFELPGHIVWFERPGNDATQLRLGIQLHLELTTAVTRQAYATWIVGLSNRRV